jgi:hypothetical protein
VVDLVLSLINPTPPLKSSKVFSPVLSSIDPTPPLKRIKLVDTVMLSTDPTPPLKSETKVVDLVLPPVNLTPRLKSEDVAQVYLVNIDSPRQGGTPPISMAPPSSNQLISIDWNHLTKPYLPSYMPFQITMQVFDRNVSNTVIDEGALLASYL